MGMRFGMLLAAVCLVGLTACGADTNRSSAPVSAASPSPAAVSTAEASKPADAKKEEPLQTKTADSAASPAKAGEPSPTASPVKVGDASKTASLAPTASPSRTEEPVKPSPKPTAAPESPKPDQIYKDNCLSCHGGGLEGKIGPDLRKVGGSMGAEEIRTQILEGSDSMPAFGKRLSKDEVEALVQWLSNKK